MIFGIDFDGCMNEDVACFRDVIGTLRRHGHEAVVVTARREAGDTDVTTAVGDTLLPYVGKAVPVVFCDGRPKAIVAREHGFDVDVWIDDHPERIATGVFRRREKRWR